jgi:hypothetical protein
MRENPGWFSLIGGRFAPACSHSGIRIGLIHEERVHLATLGDQ